MVKQKFSTKWKGSSQPRKKRKFAANAPLHIKKKMLGANLSKELRKKHGKRSLAVHKGDQVKIVRGKFKKKSGKVLEVKTKSGKVIVEGIQVKKMEGSNAPVPMRASNLQIIELNLDDKKRIKSLNKEEKKTVKQEKVKETKQTKEKKK